MSALRGTEAAAVAWTEDDTNLVNGALKTIKNCERKINEAVCAIIRHPAFGVKFANFKSILDRDIALFQSQNAGASEQKEALEPSPLPQLKDSVEMLETFEDVASCVPQILKMFTKTILATGEEASSSEDDSTTDTVQELIPPAEEHMTKELQVRKTFPNTEISVQQAREIVNAYPFKPNRVSYIPASLYLIALRTLSTDPIFGAHFKDQTIEFSTSIPKLIAERIVNVKARQMSRELKKIGERCRTQ